MSLRTELDFFKRMRTPSGRLVPLVNRCLSTCRSLFVKSADIEFVSLAGLIIGCHHPQVVMVLIYDVLSRRALSSLSDHGRCPSNIGDGQSMSKLRAFFFKRRAAFRVSHAAREKLSGKCPILNSCPRLSDMSEAAVRLFLLVSTSQLCAPCQVEDSPGLCPCPFSRPVHRSCTTSLAHPSHLLRRSHWWLRRPSNM